MSTHHIIQKKIPPREDSASPQKIPRIIMQTFKSAEVPGGMYDAAMSWVNNNPDYEYRFYDDDDCKALISKHFSQDTMDAYNKLEIGAFKADLWRYCALYVHGGVYMDIDTVSLSSLDAFIDPEDEFITPFAGMVTGGVFNAVIGCIPGHPFLSRAIEEATRLTHIGGADHPLAITGPLCLGRAINHVIGRTRDTEFLEGVYTIGGHSFKILEKIRSPDPAKRAVAYSGKPLLMCKYEGYDTELQNSGQRHWMGFFQNK